MGSVGVQLDQLKQRVDNLPSLNGSKIEVRNVLLKDKDKVREILSIRDSLQGKGRLVEPEVKQVYLDRVYTTQEYLEKKKLNEYVDKPIHELAEGVYYQGDVVVTDGNHRLALAKLNNQGTVRMRVIDLEKRPKLKFRR